MNKFHEFICKSEVFIAKYTMAIIAVLIFGSAVARFLHYPIVWAVDASTFLFAWCVFLSGDAALRNDKLMSIDIITSRLPKKAQHIIKIFNYFIILLFLTAMIGYGSWLSYTTKLRTFQGIPGFSYTWVTISVPLGCVLMLVTTIRKIRGQFRLMNEPAAIQKDGGITEAI